VEDTWFRRDLPVLDAAVELLQKQDFVAVKDIAATTGMDTEDVAQSLLDMRYEFVSEINSMGRQEDWDISRVSAAARRAVGQWPTPENLVEQLAAGLSALLSTRPTRNRARTSGPSLASSVTPARI
jgi:hypothetical protein